jgi:hypothetical protein
MDTGFLNYKTVFDINQRLLLSEDKPSNFTPLDNLLVDYWIHRGAITHEICDSQLTLARRLGCSDRHAIAASFARLSSAGWITVCYHGKGNTRGVQINVDKLPACAPVRAKITKQAENLAFRYQVAIEKLTSRIRFPNNWLKRQEPSAQQILTRCGNDIERAAQIIGYGMNHSPKYKRRVKMSLYNALRVWPGLVREYEHWQEFLRQKQEQKGSENEHANERRAAA